MIDFGTGGLGDPATDLACLLSNYGETLTRLIVPSYPRLDALLLRARFWYSTLELQWALAALTQGNKGLMVAHIGAARDIW